MESEAYECALGDSQQFLTGHHFYMLLLHQIDKNLKFAICLPSRENDIPMLLHTILTNTVHGIMNSEYV